MWSSLLVVFSAGCWQHRLQDWRLSKRQWNSGSSAERERSVTSSRTVHLFVFISVPLVSHEFSYIMIFNADNATIAVYRASQTVGCDQLRWLIGWSGFACMSWKRSMRRSETTPETWSSPSRFVCYYLGFAAIMLGREVAFVQEGSMQLQKAATPMCYIVWRL